MIWLTWRQHRGELFVVCLVLAGLGILLLVTGLDAATAFHQLGVGACLSGTAQGNCPAIVETFRGQFGSRESLIPWLNLAPLLVGMLIGAPLVAREWEQGSQRLVWTQGITRGRWVAVILALLLGVGLVLAVALTSLVTWWRAPWDQLDGRFGPAGFDFEGIVPLAYVTFALALGITAGTLLRRTIPAMVVTLVGFLGVRLLVQGVLRPHFQAPLMQTWDPYLTNPAVMGSRADWTLFDGWVTKQGQSIDQSQILQTCASNQAQFVVQPGTSFTACTHAHGWLEQTLWQPADRFWRFQGIEAAIFLALAALLLGVTVWWVRERL